MGSLSGHSWPIKGNIIKTWCFVLKLPPPRKLSKERTEEFADKRNAGNFELFRISQVLRWRETTAYWERLFKHLVIPKRKNFAQFRVTFGELFTNLCCSLNQMTNFFLNFRFKRINDLRLDDFWDKKAAKLWLKLLLSSSRSLLVLIFPKNMANRLKNFFSNPQFQSTLDFCTEASAQSAVNSLSQLSRERNVSNESSLEGARRILIQKASRSRTMRASDSSWMER